MPLLAFDLGGTKLTTAVFSETGEIVFSNVTPLNNKGGEEVGALITKSIKNIKEASSIPGLIVKAIGICVPGIYYHQSGNVWAPNISGWENYPLLDEIKKAAPGVPVTIDSDRACYILGESWKGNAKGCKDAIFLAVGTGIGAGIITDGQVLRGAHDIAGAIGWMALNKPFTDKYTQCGCFEYYASGEGIARLACIWLEEEKNYAGELKHIPQNEITSYHVFRAYENEDKLAIKVLSECIEYWGMACANLVSLFNPEKMIFGGGIFGPAVPLIPQIKKEAAKWAQPISMKQVIFEPALLGSDAGVFGAGFLALKNIQPRL